MCRPHPRTSPSPRPDPPSRGSPGTGWARQWTGRSPTCGLSPNSAACAATRRCRRAACSRCSAHPRRRAARTGHDSLVKRIGFLSFGHWQAVPGSLTRTAADAYLQAIELAEAAEEIGIDGAYLRVHHFARQFASPFPLLSAMAARTKTIELGTGVIDMRYENPLYMAEEAAIADLISGGRLQLGVSRGSPETALRGFESFGYVPGEGSTDADDARARTEVFRAAIAGAGVARANPQMTGSTGALAIQPQAPGLADRIWWGSGTRSTATWTAEQGMNLMSSTLLSEDTGVPFHELQAEQIALYREAWAAAGWDREPRVSVSRSILPITNDMDELYFGERADGEGEDQVGYLDGGLARFGKSYIGSPEQIVRELERDTAVQAADTVLVTVPNQLGVDYNTHLLQSIVRDIAPAVGWR
ncbi:LLM class flavin-dependent oxidoreductase [Amnibacterium flavum]|uniref:LLM class flavin-dependent oxidoreductase n=1 Tax=Amnibacterium flavum TaxID=2173173 RepID=A0A2V1HTV7_9MICO|nr:LLM class flavin-dependent oxidoreductase [Amnibacterium flavum]